MLAFWLTVTFTSFGLFAPRDAIAVGVLFLGALSLAASLFLIEELGHPIDGLITISRVPMDKALSYLGQ